ncbi:MAG: hypothetical protein HOV81_27555, partial [Kofleriaceae bacterium]|nr:hypothetical protein [Kofleriaceae bacterium]
MAEPTWLDRVVTEVRLHAEAALLRRLNAGSGFADARSASQIYLRDEGALARLAGGTLRPQGTHKKAAEELAKAIAAAGGHDTRATRLGTLSKRLAIDPIGGGLMVTALAYALDLDMREIVHALAPRRKPALYVETCVDILGLPAPDMLAAIAPGSPLRRNRVVVTGGDGLEAEVSLHPAVLAWLLG